jgi:galactosyl transferase GMA12/MNN10 family
MNPSPPDLIVTTSHSGGSSKATVPTIVMSASSSTGNISFDDEEYDPANDDSEDTTDVDCDRADLDEEDPWHRKKKKNKPSSVKKRLSHGLHRRGMLPSSSSGGSWLYNSKHRIKAGASSRWISMLCCFQQPTSKFTVGCVGLVLLILSGHRLLSLYMTHRQWINAPITYLPRVCPRPPYATITDALKKTTPNTEPQQQRRLQATPAGADPARQSLLLLNVDAAKSEHAPAPAAGTPPQTFELPPGLDLTNINLKPRICVTTLTDSRSTSLIQRMLRWRNFDGILELTWQNKFAYAMKHGYTFYDGSADIDVSRPPAWSKIKAVQHLLRQTVTKQGSEEVTNKCDWVMWSDADTVIMNSDVRMEDFLPLDSNVDLLVGSDNGGGYNSGVWVVRNSEWGRNFMQSWWDMTDFVRPPGFSLSGDNNAMKALLARYEQQPAAGSPAGSNGRSEFDVHVAVPARCTFNSFARFLTLHESVSVLDDLESQPWYLSPNYYHKGDFIAHTPGYDNKAECLQLLLNEAK